LSANLPYCEYGLKSTIGNQFWESFHYKNSSTGVQLNVFWQSDNKVSVGVFDPRITHKFDRNKTVLERTGKFNNEILESYCRKYLC